MRNIVGLICVAMIIAACGANPQGPKAGSGAKLYEAVVSKNVPQIQVIDSKTHAIERRLPLGAPSSDWKHLYSIIGASLVDTSPQSGDTINTLILPGAYKMPLATNTGLPGGLSPDGHWLVVEAFDGTATSMLLIDIASFKIADHIGLAGRFDFDAVSDDGQRLYLIQYLNGKEYYVRLYDVPAKSLDANIVVDKSDGNQAMAGLRLSGVAAPDGSMLFSMYVRENDSPFIHALNLTGPFAFCLDLPGGGYEQGNAAMHWSLAMRHDGSRLYAVNGATGTVAELDTSSQFSPQVLRTATIGAGGSEAAGANAAVLSADGKTLVTARSSGLVWIDTSTLRPRMEALTEWRISSVGLSPDGGTLFAVNDGGQVAEISMSSGAVTGRFDPSAGTVIALMRVASA
jgi:hypothetical protein